MFVHKKQYHNMWAQSPTPSCMIIPYTSVHVSRICSCIFVWIRFLAKIHMRMHIRMCTRGQIWMKTFGYETCCVGTHVLWVLDKSFTDSTELLSLYFLLSTGVDKRFGQDLPAKNGSLCIKAPGLCWMDKLLIQPQVVKTNIKRKRLVTAASKWR